MNNNFASEIEILKDFGKRIRETRIRKNITQNELSKKTGISVATVARIENGEDTKFSNIIRILVQLGLSDNLDLMIPEAQPDFKKIYYDEKNRQRAGRKKKQVESQWQWGEDTDKK